MDEISTRASSTRLEVYVGKRRYLRSMLVVETTLSLLCVVHCITKAISEGRRLYVVYEDICTLPLVLD